jgi:hypothetical protein
MAVVINEFEVIAAPPPAADSASQGPEKAAPPPSPPTIHDIAHIVRRHAERAERVRAH